MSRPTRAVIDIQALRHNYQLAQSLAPESKTIPMVKANAYGHGAVKVSQALADIAPAFGVACIEEALELRDAGIKQPILLLEGAFDAAELKLAATKGFWVMVENHQQKEAIINADLAMPLTVWLGVDTGMHRLGFQPEDIAEVYKTLNSSRNISQPIVFTSHFACADDLNNKATLKQIDAFKACAPVTALQSLANSAAILAWPKAQREWQRPGYMLYGNSPFAVPQENADQLKPVMSFESAVISLRTIAAGESVGYTANWTAERDSTIATITVGYGDGYPRNATNGTPVLINGVRCPLVGRVSMDMITVDVTDLREVAIGNKALLWGPELPVNEVASHCDTIGYELLTRMPGRVPRVYL
ncbi:alanine racemase [Porticoccaceae bacterium]|nr:alanine racemase [Porticoccaceae bacterium]MDB9969624.1 alanine racemase [Porticoccaceae bacterium]MDC0010964.1 alanine racemase [Porticoccaceae bacterium]MDC1453688.1 alanine racemase [Porticoccaceae bacterium]